MNAEATTVPPWWQLNRLKSERDAAAAYGRLCELDPALALLLARVMREQPTTQGFDGWPKRRLAALVGPHARKSIPALRTAEAYRIAFEFLFSFAFDKPGAPPAKARNDEDES